MGALAAATPAAYYIPPPPADCGPNAYWTRLCDAETGPGYTRYPRELHALLYRVTGGNATAMAICHEIVDKTHGEIKRKGGDRPEWTGPLSTEHFASLLGVTVKAIQDAMSILVDGEIIARRPAAKRDFCYQVRPWAWEGLAASASGKTAHGAQDDDSENQAKPPVLKLTDVPLVVLPGKRSRPVPLDDAMRSTMRSVAWLNSTSHELKFASTMSGGSLCIEVLDMAISTKNTSPRSLEVVDNVNKRFPDRHKQKISATVGATAEKAKEQRTQTKHSSISDAASIARLRDGINERFARKGALVIPIDDATLERIAAHLHGPVEDFFALLDTERQRKRVIAEGYGLLAHLAKDVPTQVDHRPYQIARLKGLGFEESAAQAQIDRWIRAGWNVEHSLRDAELADAQASTVRD